MSDGGGGGGSGVNLEAMYQTTLLCFKCKTPQLAQGTLSVMRILSHRCKGKNEK